MVKMANLVNLKLGPERVDGRIIDKAKVAMMTNLNRIAGTVPEMPALLKNLDLRFNDFSGDISKQFGGLGFDNVAKINELDFGFNNFTGPIPDTFPAYWSSKQKYDRISVFAFDNNQLSGDLPESLCNLTLVLDDNNCMLQNNKFGLEDKCPKSCDGLPFEDGAPQGMMRCFYQECYAKCHSAEDAEPCWVTATSHLDQACSTTCAKHCTVGCPPTPCTTLDDKAGFAKCPKAKAEASTPPSTSPQLRGGTTTPHTWHPTIA